MQHRDPLYAIFLHAVEKTHSIATLKQLLAESQGLASLPRDALSEIIREKIAMLAPPLPEEPKEACLEESEPIFDETFSGEIDEEAPTTIEPEALVEDSSESPSTDQTIADEPSSPTDPS